MTEATYLNLDKKLFELFLPLSQCLGRVEEMLQTPGLLREDVWAQQVLCEVGNTTAWVLVLTQAAHESARAEASSGQSALTAFLPPYFADTGSGAEKALLSHE